MTSKLFAAVAIAALTSGCGLFERESPTAPAPVSQTTTTTVIVNAPPTPAPTPTPSTAPGGGIATEAKVTEIGGDGQKRHAVDERFTLTYTRFNGSAEVQGDPRVDRIIWSIDTNGGVIADLGSPRLTDERGAFTQVYNRDIRALKRGTFTATASFDGALVASYVGTVE